MARPRLVTIEICVQTMTGYPETIALARWCEAAGVPALAVADHYLSGFDTESAAYDQLVILGGIARETTTLELSTLVSPLTFRHPAVHLKAAVTLDAMSAGRFTLGIGAGWMELEHESFGLELPPIQERFDRLEENLGYLRAALDGSGSGFQGRYYQLAAFTPHPRPTNLRIVVGGGGKRRTPELAGRFAHEYNAFPDPVPMAPRVHRCLEAARTAGRDPSSLLLSTAFPAAVATDAEAADRMIERRAKRMKVDPEEAAASLDTYGIPRGTPDEAAARYAVIAEAGITRVYLQLSGAHPDDIERAVVAARHAAALAAA
ncbi:MAG TPA: LLM class flavin-dependent oxidoreductase [Acidimicrobiia bacterium]|nr:LLM class flavin-dependent oxidoreductase [Acidimicrobiia bacterium]